MLINQNTLAISSYNSAGFGLAAQNQIDKFLLYSDIVCMQKHFLLDSSDKQYSNTDKLKSKFGKTHDMYIVPAVKESSQISKGRGSGSLATIWSKSLTKFVSKQNCVSIGVSGGLF